MHRMETIVCRNGIRDEFIFDNFINRMKLESLKDFYNEILEMSNEQLRKLSTGTLDEKAIMSLVDFQKRVYDSIAEIDATFVAIDGFEEKMNKQYSDVDDKNFAIDTNVSRCIIDTIMDKLDKGFVLQTPTEFEEVPLSEADKW